MVALRKRAPSRMTLDEFLVWDADDTIGRRWQLIDGEPVLMAPAADRHARIHGELVRLIGNHLLATGSPCSVIDAPGIVPRVRSNENYRVPDIGVTFAPPSDSQIVPDPILLIEILSPFNEAKTRFNIWAFTTIPTLREIVAVRQTRMEAELLRRDDDGNWPAQAAIIRPPMSLVLSSIAFSEPLADIYRTAGLPR